MTIRRLLWPVLIPAMLFAQGTSTGGSTLKLPQHSMAASLADLCTVESGRLEAAGINPASLAGSVDATSIAFTHLSWIQNVSGQRLGLSFSTSIGRFSASTAISKVPGIEVRDAPGPFVATFDAQAAFFQAGWANSISDGIVLGVAASYLYEKLYVYESTGFSVDAGVLLKTPVDDLVVGLSTVNLGALSAFREASVELPSIFRLAAGYRFAIGPIEFRPGAAFRTGINHEASGLTVGGTLMFDNMLGFRASWRSGESSRDVALGLTAGYLGIGLEYALVPFSSGLGTAQLLTVAMNF